VGRHFVRPEQRNTAVPPIVRPVGRQPLASAGELRDPKSMENRVPSEIPRAIANRDKELLFIVTSYTSPNSIIITDRGNRAEILMHT
jgi:hypothetical protein